MNNEKFVATESSSIVKSSRLTPVEVARIKTLEELTPAEERDRYRLELGGRTGILSSR